jgi:hypothetical protein
VSGPAHLCVGVSVSVCLGLPLLRLHWDQRVHDRVLVVARLERCSHTRSLGSANGDSDGAQVRSPTRRSAG